MSQLWSTVGDVVHSGKVLPSYGGLDLCNELFLLHRAVAHAGWSREGFLRVWCDSVAEQAGAIVRRRVLLQVA